MSRQSRTIQGIGLKALYLASTAMFATGAFAAQQVADSGPKLEEVVVTSRKVNENIQNVPLTVNVLSANELLNRGIETTSNLSASVPNLVWSDAGGGTMQNRLTLRGIYSNATSQGFDPGVAIYLDDIYIGNQFGFNSSLLDIDRIEVLKGPQGTLFGRNTSAGAISVHTKRPSTDGFSADGNLRIGNYDTYQVRALANVPISDKAAFKISGIYDDRGGYQTNSRTGKRDLNDNHYWGGRGQILFLPSDNLDLLATFDYFKQNDHQDVYSCVTRPGSFPCPNATRADVANDIAGDNDTKTGRTTWGASLNATWRVGDGYEVTSITAFRGLHVYEDQDQDYTATDLTRSGFYVPKDNQFSEELRVASPQSDKLRGVAGTYFFHENRITNIPVVFKPAALAAFGSSSTADFVQTTNSQLKPTSWAVFGQGEYDIIPSVTAEGGVRYTTEKRSFTYEQTENAVLATIPPPVQSALSLLPFPKGSAKATFDKVTGDASLRWKPTDNITTYGRFATGFKSGGFQAATNSPLYNPLVPFAPENSDQWEVGIKTKTLNDRLLFNVAGFTTGYDDIQVQITDPITLQKVVGNFGSARSKGIEVEATALLTEGLTVNGNFGVQKSRFVTGTLVGRKFQYVPKVTASGTVTYEHPVIDGWNGLVTSTVTYRSSINLNTQATTSPNFLASPKAAWVNGRIGVERDDGLLGVYLWGNNLTDIRRFTNFTPASTPTPESFHITAPRTFGVEIRLHL